MTLVPKREYAVLLVGDIVIFILALWLTLACAIFRSRRRSVFRLHLVPFSLLFVVWVLVFFIAGLYGRHSRLFRRKLMGTILYTQAVNIVIAALFFFLIPAFGIAPKTTASLVSRRLIPPDHRMARVCFPAPAYLAPPEGGLDRRRSRRCGTCP